MGLFSFVGALILGLVAGVFAALPFMAAAAALYEPLAHFLPPHPPNIVFSLFMVALYVIWLFALRAITRKVGLQNFALVFLFVLPLPSVVINFEWGKALDEQFGHRSDLTTAPNAKVRVAPRVAVRFVAGGPR